MKNNTYIQAEKIKDDKFDPDDEMDKVAKRSKSMIMTPTISDFKRSSEDEARLVQEQIDRALAQLDWAQIKYLERLEVAKRAGIVDSTQYSRAMVDTSSPTGLFARLKEKVRRDYNNI